MGETRTGERVHYRVSGGVGHIVLDDGKANAMQSAWLTEMNSVLDAAGADETRALVLSGRPGFFSGGLDLEVLPRLDPDALRATTDAFVATMRRLFLFEKPIVAASAGHAIAGGMMLLLCADRRLAADEGTARYGLNEAVTGIPLTGGTLGLCTAQIPPRHHTELILHGRLVDARGARERGLVDELVAAEGLVDRAFENARSLFDLEPVAYRLNKRLLRERAFDEAARAGAALVDQIPHRNVFSGIAR
jgi:enoyl-CoA hydratase/carnithine racemase